MKAKTVLLRDLKKGDRFEYFGAKYETTENAQRSKIYQGASGQDFKIKVNRIDTAQDRQNFSDLTNKLLDRFDLFLGNYNRRVNIIKD